MHRLPTPSPARDLLVAATLFAAVAQGAQAASASAGFTVRILLNGGAPVMPPPPAPGAGGPEVPAPPPVVVLPPVQPPVVQPPVQPPVTTPPVAGPPGGSGGNVPTLPAPPPVAVSPPAARPNPVATAAICVSASHSEATNAQVRVVCNTGQFVSIEPAPGRAFAGTHGGAYRFNFGPGYAFAGGLAEFGKINVGAGTVTALRVVNLGEAKTPLEMLVSF